MALAPLPAHPRRLAYLGTPAVAVPPLRALVAAGHDVGLVVTRVDKRRGRGSSLQPSPVKAAALELGLPVTHRVDDLLGQRFDLGVVVAFGQLVRPHVLAELAMVNLHFSLLPRWRGAAPVERALLAGDTVTGVCLMQLEEGLDTGGVLECRSLPIGPRDTADALRARLVEVGSDLLLRVLRQGLGPARPQEGEVTYAAKLEPHELGLRWDEPAEQLDRVVRLGGAWTTFRRRRLKVLAARPAPGRPDDPAPGVLDGDRVGAGDGVLVLEVVQPEGRGPMPVREWRNGARPAPGEVLGA